MGSNEVQDQPLEKKGTEKGDEGTEGRRGRKRRRVTSKTLKEHITLKYENHKDLYFNLFVPTEKKTTDFKSE